MQAARARRDWSVMPAVHLHRRRVTCPTCTCLPGGDAPLASVATGRPPSAVSRRAERASSVHTTQAEAQDAARRMLGNQGGGELTTMSVKGKIVSKDTIKPGNDPNPPRDTEH